jgi:hypothetical protein
MIVILIFVVMHGSDWRDWLPMWMELIVTFADELICQFLFVWHFGQKIFGKPVEPSNAPPFFFTFPLNFTPSFWHSFSIQTGAVGFSIFRRIFELKRKFQNWQFFKQLWVIRKFDQRIHPCFKKTTIEPVSEIPILCTMELTAPFHEADENRKIRDRTSHRKFDNQSQLCILQNYRFLTEKSYF